MKLKFMLIGIMMALVVCITPVAAVSADDFEVVTMMDGKLNTYTYCNINNPDEGYIKITSDSTRYSFVTFKPVGIKGAPVMIVNTTSKNADIYLPRSVDEWEIKFYSTSEYMSYLDSKYLKNLGVVNLNEISRKYISKEFELVQGKYIVLSDSKDRILIYTIPDVSTSEAFKVKLVDWGSGASYTYCNINNPDDGYISIYVHCSPYSLVTFKPANIPDAPEMIVQRGAGAHVNLLRSVDDWEIKYYSSTKLLSYPDDKYLKNAGVVNPIEHFGSYIDTVIYLARSPDPHIASTSWPYPTWHIPEV